MVQSAGLTDRRLAVEIFLLGSGGWIPTSKRETCCAYVRDGARVLLIDAGTGVHRLVEHLELLAGVERVDIVLTHFHLDHVAGLSYLPALPRPPVVWGPGKRLAGASTADILERLLGPPLFAVPLDALVSEVHEVPEEVFGIDSFRIATRVQERHSHPTLAIRVDDALTYCTDTAPDDANTDFAAGSRVLFHEAWYAAATTDDPIHSAAGDAGRIAREAGVEQLILIHVHPLLPAENELVAAARAEFARPSVGEDLVAIG